MIGGGTYTAPVEPVEEPVTPDPPKPGEEEESKVTE